MKRFVLVLMAACADNDEAAVDAPCGELQAAAKMEIGECLAEGDPTYQSGCPDVRGSLCHPSGLMSDCDPMFADLAGVGCDAFGANCHYDLPSCTSNGDGLVTFGARVVLNGERGLLVADGDTCSFRPCL